MCQAEICFALFNFLSTVFVCKYFYTLICCSTLKSNYTEYMSNWTIDISLLSCYNL